MTAPASPLRLRGYLGEGFVVEHRPPGVPRGTAVVLLPSLGYEDTCAYRPLRILADALAAQGHVVLRVDWPGLGDSAGDDATPDLVGRMVAAARAAAASLRERGALRVVGIGLRGGALLALNADGFDDYVLWAPPLGGKALLREERAFHQMAEKYFGEQPPGVVAPPAGAVEAGGFLYRAETVAALQGMTAADAIVARRPTRLLVVPRDGGEVPAALVTAAASAGAALSVGPAEGLADLLENPYQSTLSPAVRDAMLAFCATEAVAPIAAPAFAPELRLHDGVTERPWLAAAASGELSGIVCEPPGGAPADAVWTVFFNAGGVRRSGPNRLWTRAARELARQGVPSLRFDVHDVGDSDGATLPHQDLEEMYSQPTMDDVVRAVDWVQDRGAAAIDAVGLCSGAFFGMHAASQRGIRHATLINGPSYVWNDDARHAGMTNQISRSLLDGRRWKRLLTGRIDARALVVSVAQEARLSAGRAVGRLRGEAPRDEVTELLRRVARRGTQLHFVCSAGDPCVEYLDRHLAPDIKVRRTVIPGAALVAALADLVGERGLRAAMGRAAAARAAERFDVVVMARGYLGVYRGA